MTRSTGRPANRPPWTFEPVEDAAAYAVWLDPTERRVLIDAVGDVVDLLGGAGPDNDEADSGSHHGSHHTGGEQGADAAATHPLDRLRLGGEPLDTPHDPALLRLLPDAYRDAPDGAAEFRRLTEADLRASKVGHLLRLRDALADPGPDVVVPAAQAPPVAAALTDVRLVIAERLGVRTEGDADAMVRLVTTRAPAPADGAQAVERFLATLYVMLGILQESLVGLMLDDLPDEPTGPR